MKRVLRLALLGCQQRTELMVGIATDIRAPDAIDGAGDRGEPGDRIVSTTNRNFEHRQGTRVRTHLVSPATAAATAITGRIADVRQLVPGRA